MSQITIQETAREHGSHIPGDMPPVDFAYKPISALIDPLLTTVNRLALEIVSSAAAMLLERICWGASPEIPERGVLKTELIKRGLA